MKTSVTRAILLGTWVVALGLALLIVLLTEGLADEYGVGWSQAAVLGLVPLAAGLVATAVAGFSRRSVLALLALALVVVVSLPVAAVAGHRERDARLAAGDAAFSCSDHVEALVVPEEVDAAWHAMDHPEGHWLHGPLAGSTEGCSAGIAGDADASFAAWRAALLDTHWLVVRDDHDEVVVERDGVRLTLYRDGGQPMLNAATADAPACTAGRTSTSAEGEVSAC